MAWIISHSDPTSPKGYEKLQVTHMSKDEICFAYKIGKNLKYATY